jgi:hypothetical protein
VLDEGLSQQDVFERCATPAIRDFFDGINGTLMAYGQTGAGKTYTVMGPPTGEFQYRGLAPRIISEIFQEAARRRAATATRPAHHVSLHMSAIEVGFHASVMMLAALTRPCLTTARPVPQHNTDLQRAAAGPSARPTHGRP